MAYQLLMGYLLSSAIDFKLSDCNHNDIFNVLSHFCNWSFLLINGTLTSSTTSGSSSQESNGNEALLPISQSSGTAASPQDAI